MGLSWDDIQTIDEESVDKLLIAHLAIQEIREDRADAVKR